MERASRPLLPWLGLAVFMLASLLANVDRQIFALLAGGLKTDLGLSDTQFGLLQGVGLSLAVTFVSLPIGWLADRADRRFVLAGCICVWSVATAACSQVHSFGALMAAAIVIGIGEAGLGPVVYGMIPDMFPPARRAMANAIFSSGANLSAGVGLTIAGLVVGMADTIRPFAPASVQGADWRLSFLVVGLPGPLVALLLLLVRTRRRTATGAAQGDATRPAGLLRHLSAHRRTVASLYGAFAAFGFAMTGALTWIPVLAMRQHGATAPAVGAGIGAAFIGASVVGTVLTIAVLKWQGARLTPARLIRLVAGLMLVSGLVAFGIGAARTGPQLYLASAILLTPFMAALSILPTVMQDMSPPHLVSRVVAIGLMATALFGAAGPIAVGMLSDALQARPDALALAITGTAVVALLLSAGLFWSVIYPFAATARDCAAADGASAQSAA